MQSIGILFGLFFLWNSNIYAQDNEALEQYFEQRKAMIRKMLESFDASMNVDDLFDESDRKLLGLSSPAGVSVETEKLSDGRMLVKIKPLDQNTKLDLKVSDTDITISSVSESKATGHSYFSKSSQVIPIPEGYYAQGPEQKGEEIIYHLLPGKSGGLKKNKNPLPLPKSDKAPLFKKPEGQAI